MMPSNTPPSNPFPQQNHQQQQHSENVFSIDSEDVSFQPVNAGFAGNNYPPQQTEPTTPPSAPASNGCFQTLKSCFQISSLQKYFDVDTLDVKTRLVGSLRHAHKPGYFLGTILNCEGKNADLYGPFWICMTLSWFLAVTANTSKFLHQNESLSDVEFDVTHLFHSFAVILVFTFILPTILYIIIRYLVQNRSQLQPFVLVDLISLYGYSLVPYLFATVLCVLPMPLFDWVVLLLATFWSMLLVLRNLAAPLLSSTQDENGVKKEKLVGSFLMIVVGSHTVLCLVLKFMFYRHRKTSGHHSNDSGSDTSDGENVTPGDDYDGSSDPNDDFDDNAGNNRLFY